MKETIKLIAPSQDPDAFYNDEQVLVEFVLDDIFPETRKEWPIYAGQEDILLFMDHRRSYLKIKNSKCSDETFEMYLHEILNSGKITIFSKTEKMFVYEIKKEKYGFSAGPLAGAGGYKYYLPDGTLFFSIRTWVS